MKYYRVLALDGGGVRGVIPIALLQRLESLFPFLQEIDLIAGTSTGGIIALGLAAGYTPADIRRIYETMAAQVFADSIVDDILDLGKLVGADYSNTNLQRILREEFGARTLGDLAKKVLISTFDLDNQPSSPGSLRTWKAKFFHNFPGEDSDADESVVDVALRTSAAPTYFPIFQGYVDGGVVANNPAMCALAQALHTTTAGQPLERVVLLSMGTGHNPTYLEVEDGDWGLAQWARHLVSLMLEGSVGLADYQCRQVLADRYYRLNPVLPEPIGLDRVDRIGALIRLADRLDLSEALEWLGRYFTGNEGP